MTIFTKTYRLNLSPVEQEAFSSPGMDVVWFDHDFENNEVSARFVSADTHVHSKDVVNSKQELLERLHQQLGKRIIRDVTEDDADPRRKFLIFVNANDPRVQKKGKDYENLVENSPEQHEIEVPEHHVAEMNAQLKAEGLPAIIPDDHRVKTRTVMSGEAGNPTKLEIESKVQVMRMARVDEG